MGLFTIQRMSDVQLFYAFEPFAKNWSQPTWYFRKSIYRIGTAIYVTNIQIIGKKKKRFLFCLITEV